MKRPVCLLHLGLCLACLPMMACGGASNEDIPGVVPPLEEKPDPGKPDEEEPVHTPDISGPYVYDDDLGYDSEAYLKAYKGTAYKTNAVPGTVEAEDFDKGNESVAYYESDDKTADASYRGDHAVEIRKDGAASNGYYIGEVQPGEWMCYTIDVAEDGSYAIDTYVVKGDGSEGSFYFEVDGRGASRSLVIPQGGWSDFSKMVTADNIQLSKGRHVLKYFGSTPGNLDRFVFRRTGDLQSISGGTDYPVTREMYNPLFTDFGSPMFNSWLKGNLYTADPSAHVWNINGKEVLYVYASHDMEPAAGCDRMDRYHVFSTEDMVHWTDHGEIMNAATCKLQAGWGSEGFMWAPDCVYNPANQLYYFYFPHPSDTKNWNKTWRTGVAVSKYPDKEFRVVAYVEGMPAEIDPCVFIDDDGQAYIYNGGGGHCYGGKLKKNDWTKLDGKMKAMEGLDDFHEGTWVHKYNGKYYLSYADNNGYNNRLKYAVSNSPLGPWEYKDVYLDVTTCDTSHGSIVQFKGQWYAFYHCCDVSGQGTLRSVCVDKLYYNADGTIQRVKQTRGKQ